MAEVNAGDRPPGRRVWPVRRRPAPEDIAVQEIAVQEAADERPPVLDPEPPPRLNIAAVRLGALGLALVLALIVALIRLFGGGPPSVADLRTQAGVDGWSVLPIGVKADQPGTAYRNADGTWSGFDIDIAYMIAEDLGFGRGEVRFYSMQSEDRARMQATDAGGGRVPVQMVIASYSITPAREAMAGVTFSAPYLFTEQSVLTLAKDRFRVTALSDLSGRQVCSLSTSTSITAAEQAGAIVHKRNQMQECIEDMRNDRVDAVTTDAAILAGYKDRFPAEFDHWDLGLDTTEAYGVNVGENEALRTLVDLTLYRSLKDPRDDRWELAYERNLQTETVRNGRTPIAVAQQPDVPEPRVRELPWEDVKP